MKVVFWIGLSQGLFATILMFNKRESNIADKLLAIWLGLLSFDFLTSGIDHEIFQKPLLSSSFLLFNPALFLYIRALTVAEFRLKWIYLLHLLPYFIFKLLAYYFQVPFSMRNFLASDQYFAYRIIFGTASVLSVFIYNTLSLIKVHQHRMRLKNEESTIEKNESLTWVLFVSIFYTVYCLVAIIVASVSYFSESYPMAPHIYNYIVLLFLIFVLSFYGLYQRKLKNVEPEPVSSKTPYQNSSLTDDSKSLIQEKIEAYMQKEKPYLNFEMNMEMLSNAIKVPKYQITEVLNTQMGKNFFQFVNEYRVAAVKQMLENPDNPYSIESIGYECGFSSKSSFYTVFKNLTGKTPNAYRNAVKENK